MPLLSPKTLPPPLLRVLSLSPTRRLSAEASSQKLDRIADELLALTTAERRDYSLLFRRKLGLSGWVPAGGAAALAGLASPLLEAEGGVQAAEAKEKTAFDVKLEKFEAAAKIKIIKEVRTFTDLGLKEAKELVEKAPVVLKMGLPKEEAEKILAKLKDAGATVVLE